MKTIKIILIIETTNPDAELPNYAQDTAEGILAILDGSPYEKVIKAEGETIN